MRPTEWTGSVVATLSDCFEVQPGLFKNLVWVVEERN